MRRGIYLIVGKTGYGKTLTLLYYTFMAYLQGSNILSNFKLKNIPYTPLDNITDLHSIQDGENFASCDEIWSDSDSRRSGSNDNILFTKMVLQHRKKRITLMGTSQHYGAVDVRIRAIADAVLYPSIAYWGSRLDEDGILEMIPMILRVDVHDFAEYDRPMRKPEYSITIPMVYSGVYIPDLYETEEIVESMNSGGVDLDTLIERYSNLGKTKSSALASHIYLEQIKLKDPIPKNLCSDIARYIME